MTMAAGGTVEEGLIRAHVQKAGKWRDSVAPMRAGVVKACGIPAR